MNNYGRSQMNPRARQGNMQHHNPMNRNQCGCNEDRRSARTGGIERRTVTDSCGCNENRRPVEPCGCSEPPVTAGNCGCNEARISINTTSFVERTPAESCGCEFPSLHGTEGCHASSFDRLSGLALAMSYVPWQTFCQTYDCEVALGQGTIFKELDKDFRRGCCS